MHVAVGLVALLSAVLATTVISRRIGLPEPLMLTFVGVLGSYLSFVPDFELSSELVLLGLLPPLLFAAATNTSLVDFRTQLIPIGMLSVGLVLFTATGVALVASWLLHIPFAAGFALGAVVAPPDAVAATAVARSIGLPRRIVTLLEGESLVNDATAIVALRTAIIAISGSVTLLYVATSFLVSAVGGVLVGLVVAWVVNRVLPLLHDAPTAVGLGLLSPWIAYIAAEEVQLSVNHQHLTASGVLAVVVAGLLIAHKAPYQQTALTRVSNRLNWATIQFLLENTVFLLMGLQVRSIVDDLSNSELGWGTITVGLIGVLLAVLLLRPIWMFFFQVVTRRGPNHLAWQETAVASWAGMRGVVTLAAAFILPQNTHHREVLVAAALVVVGGTLVLQGATLAWLARRLKVQGPDAREDALQEAQILQSATRAGLDLLEHKRASPDFAVDDAIADDLRVRSERRVNAVWESLRVGVSDCETPSEIYRRTRLKMLQAERAEVLRIRDEGGADHEVLERVMASLDVEESMLEFAAAQEVADTTSELRTPTVAQSTCEHLTEAADWPLPTPLSPNCADCEREGTTPVHLRMCLTCGYVGCCDSSEPMHSTRHFQQTGHPVMQSFESGEAWRWCYVDERLS